MESRLTTNHTHTAPRPQNHTPDTEMESRFIVDGNTLTAHVARTSRSRASNHPGVVVAHGFPTEPGGGINSTSTMPALADRIAAETGFSALAYTSRGIAASEGDFSLGGWRRDLAGAIDLLADRAGCEDVWLIGFGTGGALAIVVGSTDERVRGIAAVGAPADFEDWARSPRKLLVWSREVKVIRDRQFPVSLDRWASELRSIRAQDAAARLGDKALLVLHGSEDETVPLLDARAIASAHPNADLRIINGAGHHLRHDPRAVAMLLGWLERQLQKHRKQQITPPPQLFS